jgi:sec-independent protein translocase protein TatA
LTVIGDILQPTHLLFILVIALLVLGPKRLPEVGRSLGRGLRDFRMAISGDEPEPAETLPPQPVAAATPPAAQPAEQPAVAAPAGQSAPPSEHSD